ncbi:MAG: hypothetical protein JWR10_3439 [Rubritepida sp.]|nr:hypothetical protein [Rubritepida sp.]
MRLAQHLQVLIDRALPESRQRQIAADYARGVRDGLIASGRAPPHFTTAVDGREGVAEEAVRLDGGHIRYEFGSLANAVQFALDYLRERSPVLTGDYRASWMVLVNGSPWRQAVSEIPGDAEAVVVNDRPFARLLEVGSNGKASARRVRRVKYKNRRGHERTKLLTSTTDCAAEVQKRWPDLFVARQFVRLSGGKNDVPYIAKSGEITYPAVIIRAN